MNWKKNTLIALWSLAALGWLVALGFLAFSATKTTLMFAFGGAAVISEIAIYATAAVLGITVAQSRKRIWASVKGIASPKKPINKTP